ncbi:MAG: hypothetical protein DLM68_15875 [Hyphomicrobiales bacterium]|nr:MAG: hypothetical protein DLM68_15875 [Hyphomicrobiales bacterium]
MRDACRVAWMELQELAAAMLDDAGIIPGDIVQYPGSGAKPGAFWIPRNLPSLPNSASSRVEPCQSPSVRNNIFRPAVAFVFKGSLPQALNYY